MTVREAVAAGAERLATVPELAEDASRDAEWLLLQRLAWTRADLRAHPERELTAAELGEYGMRLQRRLRCEPVQYILGEQEFFGLRLRVTPAVLIPRPETELLVEAVLQQLSPDAALRVLDVGTGSGAIAVALAVQRPLWQITALDLSTTALAVAEENAHRHGVAIRVRCIQSDLLAMVTKERFDCIVSNPPYVPEADRTTLHPQVREYEPEIALFAGETGMAVYERLIPDTREILNTGGLLAMEIGYGKREAVSRLLEGWDGVQFLTDLQGISRVVLARRG